MNVMWRAACAAVLLLASTTIEIGCGDTYRPIATPAPVTTGNPSGPETEVVLSCCLDATKNPIGGSVLTAINVSGDTNSGNKVVGSVSNSVAFDYNRTTVYTTNYPTGSTTLTPPPTPSINTPYSLTNVLLNNATTGLSANTTTVALDPGSAPIGMSFQYFGSTYTLDYSVNSGFTATCPTTGSLGAISQAANQLKATICVGADPVAAWIYKDQSKVFVLDNAENQVYVVSASQFKVTNKIAVGTAPIKAAQSADGMYVYVLNAGNGTTAPSISIIDGLAESEVGRVTLAGSPKAVDISQIVNTSDTTQNLQYNHVWVLQADGTVSIFDGTTPGVLRLLTSVATITSSTIPSGMTAAAVTPTNLALLRDGTEAYVGLKNTDRIVAINTSKLAMDGSVTNNATTAITVGIHRSVSQTLTNNLTSTTISKTVPVEVTTPVVTSIAVSRGGDSADLSKVYATTTTNTTYYCYDQNVLPTACDGSLGSDPWYAGTPIQFLPPSAPFLDAAGNCTAGAGQVYMTCPNLYNGTAVVTAAANGSTPINTYVTTIPTPSVVTYCDPGNPGTGEYDGQKNCPLTVPTMVVGRS